MEATAINARQKKPSAGNTTNGEKERGARHALRDANKESANKVAALCGSTCLSASTMFLAAIIRSSGSRLYNPVITH